MLNRLLSSSALLSTRQYARAHPAAMLAVVIGLLVVCIFFSFSAGGYFTSAPPEPLAWFVDESSGKEIVRPATEISPLTIDGNTFVRAYYFSTGSATEKNLGYYQKFSPEARQREVQRRTNSGGVMLPVLHEGYLIRAPEKNSPWVEADSPAGQAIVKAISQSATAQVREITP